MSADPRPLITHVVYRFDIGGLENGVVNLLNRLRRDDFRHAVVSLTDVTQFRQRVLRDDIEFIELRKSPGHGFKLFPRLLHLFRRLRPEIVHTRNLAALEANLPAWVAGVPIRIHGEHGRDVGDLDGSNRTYRRARRLYRPFVTHYVPVSSDLDRYLRDAIGVRGDRITAIVNGVDVARFAPSPQRSRPVGFPFSDPGLWICGTVGRLQPVKNQVALARAFVRMIQRKPEMRARLRLVVVGAGALQGDIVRILRDGGALELAWLPGARDDVAEILAALDVFVLPSLAEGISNTILEAMATGLPIVATNVGGNAELIEAGRTGELVQAGDDDALAKALLAYASDQERARAAGRAGRARAERLYGVDTMVARYAALYWRLMAMRKGSVIATPASAEAGPTTEIH